MYLRDLWSSCLRRWPLLLACLLLTGGAVFWASTAVRPTYEAKASVVLVPPVSQEDPTANRYIGLGGLKQSSDVLSRSMMSETTVREVKKVAKNAKYEVGQDPTTSAPIVTVLATSANKAAAQKMLETVLDRIPRNLTMLQQAVEIEPANQITLVPVSKDIKPETVQKTRIRALGAIVAVMLLFSALLVAAVDGVLMRRTQRRKRATDGGSGADIPRRTEGTVTRRKARSGQEETRRGVRPASGPEADETRDSPEPAVSDTPRRRLNGRVRHGGGAAKGESVKPGGARNRG